MTLKRSKEYRRASVWGSGLLAVDIVLCKEDQEAFEITAGGTCANVLSNLAHLGWNAKAKGRIGSDAAGRVLFTHLQEAGVDATEIVFDDRVATPLVIERFGLGSEEEPFHKFEWKCPRCGSAVPKFRPTPICMLNTNYKESDVPDVFFFDRPTPSNLRFAQVLKTSGAIIVFEPPRLKIEKAFQLAVGIADIVKVAAESASIYLDRWMSEGSLAIVTNGASGLSYRANKFNGIITDWLWMPSIQLTRILDACGSGDWLTAGFLHAFLAVNDLSEEVEGKLAAALKYGQALASLNCLLPGARGLSRVFDHAEISDMAAITLAKGLAAIEPQVIKRSRKTGKLRDIKAVCGYCTE